jgi:hypothetical protein
MIRFSVLKPDNPHRQGVPICHLHLLIHWLVFNVNLRNISAISWRATCICVGLSPDNLDRDLCKIINISFYKPHLFQHMSGFIPWFKFIHVLYWYVFCVYIAILNESYLFLPLYFRVKTNSIYCSHKKLVSLCPCLSVATKYHNASTVKPSHAVTSIKHSPVLKSHIFLALS